MPKKKKNTKVALKVSASVVPAPSKSARRRARRRRGILQMNGADEYLSMLQNPFHIPPKPLGFGCAVSTSIDTGFVRTAVTMAGASTAFAIIGRPTSRSCLMYYSDASNATMISASASSGVFNVTNLSVVEAELRAVRIVSYALRVSVRYAATATRGTLQAVFFPSEATADVIGASFSSIGTLEASEWAEPTSAGEISAEVQYRPLDPNSYSFTTGYISNPATPNTTIMPLAVIIGAGWPAGGFSVDAQWIVNWEGLCGTLASGTDDLRSRGLDSDQALAAASKAKFPSFTVDSTTLRNGLNTAFDAVKTAHQFRSTYQMLNGGLKMLAKGNEEDGEYVHQPSNSSSSSSTPKQLVGMRK